MNDDIIKFIGLNNVNIDKEKSFISHDKDKTIFHIYILKSDVVCPVCNSKCISHGFSPKRIIHSISTGEKCIIKYYSRRYICKTCGKTFEDKNPFSKSGYMASNYTVVSVLSELRSHTATFTSVAKKLFLNTQTVINIFDEYIYCDRKVLPEVICLDEIYTRKLTYYPYCCVIMDFKNKDLVDILHSRRKDYLIEYFGRISKKERDNVKYVVMDMYSTYKDVALQCFPNCTIAVDSFHVIKHLNDAMDKIRIKIMMRFFNNHNNINNADMHYYMLKKFHFFFKMNFDNISNRSMKINKINSRWDKYEIRKYLLSIDNDLTEAYLLWEDYYEFNYMAKLDTSTEELNELIDRFLNSNFIEFNEFGRMLKHWKDEIKNSFITIDKRRLSNGAIEGVNSRLKCLIKNSNGFNDFDHFRNRGIFAINRNVPIKLYLKKNKK